MLRSRASATLASFEHLLRSFSVPGLGTGSGAAGGTSCGLALGPSAVRRVAASWMQALKLGLRFRYQFELDRNSAVHFEGYVEHPALQFDHDADEQDF